MESDMDGIRIIRLTEAAAMLHATPQTVRIKARADKIPGRKVGKQWIFSVVALERYLNGEWEPRVAQRDGQEHESCRYTNGTTVANGITASMRACSATSRGCSRKSADSASFEVVVGLPRHVSRNSEVGDQARRGVYRGRISLAVDSSSDSAMN